MLTFKELLELVDENKSIKFYKTTNRSKHNLWQIEKSDNYQYCFKTFYYYKTQKYFFNLNGVEDKNYDVSIIKKVLLLISQYIQFVEEDKQLIDNIIDINLFENGDWLTFDTLTDNYKEQKEYKHKIEYKIFTRRKTINDKIEKTGENEIRLVLNKYLVDIYPNTLIKEEYTTGCLNVRADTVVFNGEYIHTYEIKSNKDTFSRLEEQIKGYKTYSEKITLVIDERKKEELYSKYKHLLDGIGIILYKDTKNALKPIKKAKLDKKQLDNKIKLLWAEEFDYILKIFLKSSEVRKMNKDKKAEFLLGVLNKKQINKYVNSIITYRNYKNIEGKKELDIFKLIGECGIENKKN